MGFRERLRARAETAACSAPPKKRRRAPPRKRDPMAAHFAGMKYHMYEMAMRDDSEMDFVAATYRALRGRAARRLREDFCGSFSHAAYWVSLDEVTLECSCWSHARQPMRVFEIPVTTHSVTTFRDEGGAHTEGYHS